MKITEITCIQAMEQILETKCTYADLPPLQKGDRIITGNYDRSFERLYGDNETLEVMDADGRFQDIHVGVIRMIERGHQIIFEVPWDAYRKRSEGKWGHQHWMKRISNEMIKD